jgi:hypothetical protein
MTVNSETNVENTLNQEKIDTNMSQPKLDTTPPQQPQQENIPEDPNWRAFREARKKEREENKLLQQRMAEKEAEASALKAAMEAAFSKTNHYQNERHVDNQNDRQDETEDQRIKRLVNEEIALREAQYQKQNIEREKQEYPNRLVKTYNDFHQVISQENLDYLDFHYPEVSRPLQRLNDDFDKWSDIYKAVKKFVPNSNSAKKEAAKADANFIKPKSMSSTGITQPGEPRSSAQLTEEKRAENWARMQKILKGVS